MSFWTEYLPLDASPERVLALTDEEESRRRAAMAKLAAGLAASGGTHLGERLLTVLEVAPEVLGSPAAWQWGQVILRAARNRDSSAVDSAAAEFTRFEAAGAVLAGTDWSGSWMFDGPVVLPATGTVVGKPTQPGRLTVAAGTPSAEVTSLPNARGVTVDAMDTTLRGVAAGRFEFMSSREAPSATSEVAEALNLADRLCPNLSSRLGATIVPVRARQGWAESATDERAPGMTFMSFGLTPTRLLASLAHEEAHAVLNAATTSLGLTLPPGDGLVEVPWKPEPRPLPATLHGLASFGREVTIRRRAGRVGVLDSEDAERAAKVTRWVADVSEQLLRGACGTLSPEIAGWVEGNLAAMASGIPEPPERPGLEIVAAATDSFPYRWWLLRGSASIASAAAAWQLLRGAPWRRHSTAIAHQDGVEITRLLNSSATSGLIRRFFTEEVPAVLRCAGVPAELDTLVGHRFRRGDRVRLHNDAEQNRFHIRCVLGATPGTIDGGELRLWNGRARPSISVLPAFGDVLVFEPGPSSFHEVTPVRDDRWRLTVVGSYANRVREESGR